mmetsp:Transcript_18878/g.57051  ORF Transcript_18878/g.57051 Transcript_18878/m.57051 type:complete len:129 (+) Transcript_18878:639-1025(+)|eukprot:scaffold90599_cov31-Tisochrysis_lutea.AAC.3
MASQRRSSVQLVERFLPVHPSPSSQKVTRREFGESIWCGGTQYTLPPILLANPPSASPSALSTIFDGSPVSGREALADVDCVANSCARDASASAALSGVACVHKCLAPKSMDKHWSSSLPLARRPLAG